MLTPSSPQALGDLAPIRPGEVVSHVVHRAAGGVVSTLAFAQGEGLPEHTSPREVVLVAILGELDVDLDGRSVALRTGDALTLAPHLPHAVTARTDARMLLVQLRTDASP